MFESLDKLLLAGFGAMSMTRERAEKIFDDFVQQGRAAKDQKSGFIKELMDQAEKTRTELENTVAGQVRETIEKLDLPTKKDIKRLEKKIDKLRSQES